MGSKRAVAVTENLEQRALFEEYVALGSRRRLLDLMQFTDKSWVTVQRWSVQFNWVKKAVERDKELMECAGLETPKENVKNKKLALDIVNKMIKDLAILDENGNVVGTTVQAKNVFDLRTLIDVRNEILGIKDKMDRTNKLNQQTNIDKAIFIIKK
jgi:hypothetical protein